jgi:regulator of replication initiation timing
MSIICGDCGEIIDWSGRCECFDRLTGEEIKIEKDDDEMKKNLVELLKEEIASRYNLEGEQIRIRLDIEGLEKTEAQELLADYAKYGEKPDDFFKRETTLKYKNDFTFSDSFYTVTAFIKEEE